LHSVGRLYLPSTAISPERMAQQGDWLQAGRHELIFDISSLGRSVKLNFWCGFFPRPRAFFHVFCTHPSVRRSLSGTTTAFHRINKGTFLTKIIEVRWRATYLALAFIFCHSSSCVMWLFRRLFWLHFETLPCHSLFL